MRTKDNTVDLNTLNFDAFKGSMKEAIEYFSGSPVKKEAKLFESCAIALGVKNSDLLAHKLKQADINSADALTLAKAGLCPFSREPVDSAISQRIDASFEVDEANDRLKVHRFPKGMRTEDQILWASSQPKGRVETQGVPSENFEGVTANGDEPHLHAEIAGYRKDLSRWFLSRGKEGEASHTVAYWHTNYPEFQSLPLAERLQYETHFELVISFRGDGAVQTLFLNRMFKLGNTWQISQDGNLSLGIQDNVERKNPTLNHPVLRSLLSMVIDSAMTRPAKWIDEGGRVDAKAFKTMISLDLDGYVNNYKVYLPRALSGKALSEFCLMPLEMLEGSITTANRLYDPVMHSLG